MKQKESNSAWSCYFTVPQYFSSKMQSTSKQFPNTLPNQSTGKRNMHTIAISEQLTMQLTVNKWKQWTSSTLLNIVQNQSLDGWGEKKNICIEFKNLRLFACQIDRFSTHFSDNFIFYYIFELLLSVFEWLEREKERNKRRKTRRERKNKNNSNEFVREKKSLNLCLMVVFPLHYFFIISQASTLFSFLLFICQFDRCWHCQFAFFNGRTRFLYYFTFICQTLN